MQKKYDEFYSLIKPDLDASYKPVDVKNLVCSPNGHFPVDMHIHSKFSTDGYMDVNQIVSRCIENGVEYTSITDHNSFEYIKRLRMQEKHKAHKTYFSYDGVKIFTGVEVSCKMWLSKTNNLKLHVLCYGFDTESDNILMHMISRKEQDYTRARYYSLYYLAKKDPIYQTTFTEFKNFLAEQADRQTFTGRVHYFDTLDFYLSKGIPRDKIVDDLRGFDFNNPMHDHYTIDVVDLINAVHASGGYCVIAHPTLNLERHWGLFNKHIDKDKYFMTITNKLLSVGMDGIELANRNDAHSKIYNQIYAKSFLVSCGTDTHYFGTNSCSDIGKYHTEMNEQNIAQKLLELNSAKVAKEPTKRQLQYTTILDQHTYIDFNPKNNNAKNKDKYNAHERTKN